MKNGDFYQDLVGFTDFNNLTEDKYFKDIPPCWFIFITDVKGSTKAIEEGRYKDVNTIGAAAISTTYKIFNNEDFPYVFGGDGATLLIPEDKKDQALESLLEVKRLSIAKFNLDLRVCFIQVKEVLNAGASLKLAKFELIKGKSIAIFKGGGLNLAESIIKSNEEKYSIRDTRETVSDLSGLSCRWQPIPNKNGTILSILVEARDVINSDYIYREILEKFENIVQDKFENLNPVNMNQAKYKSIYDCIKDEIRYQNSIFSFSFVMRLFEIIFAVFIFKYKLPAIFFNEKKYEKAMRSHSDYRKFDDMLRMIVDVGHEQANRIESFLLEKYKEEKIYFGLHKSENSLATCYVDNLQDGNHIHFIDGDNGGYAISAKQLKEQKTLKNKNNLKAS